MKRLYNKTIIVTGATSGIGESAVRQCLREGANVFIHGLDQEAGEKLAIELGPKAAFFKADFLDPETPCRLVEEAFTAFGKIDGIVNNAAYIVRSDLESTDAALFDKVIAVNTRAPMLLIQAALPYLKKSKGSVVNIGSINAYTGEPRLLAYAISKGGLMTLSRNLGNVLAPKGVRVNHLNLGWVLTPNEYQYKLADGLPPNWPELLDLHEIPSGKMTTPEEIALHIAFWLSDDSRPISGTVLELEQYPIIGRIPLKEGENE